MIGVVVPHSAHFTISSTEIIEHGQLNIADQFQSTSASDILSFIQFPILIQAFGSVQRIQKSHTEIASSVQTKMCCTDMNSMTLM